MKILILSNSDSGFYSFRKELVQRLLKQHSVILCFPNNGYFDYFTELGCTVIETDIHRRGKNPIHDFKLLQQYIKIVKQYKPDAVLTYTIKPNIYGGLACSITKKPYFANITGLGTSIENGGLLSFISIMLYYIGLKRAKCVFFQNNSNFTLFSEKNIVKSNAKLIPGSGVNLTDYHLESYPDEEEIIKFLFVGRLMKAKGINELFEATQSLMSSNLKIQLDIVGGYEDDVERMLKEFTKNNRINYHGRQKNILEFVKSSHCIVMPSYHEGMSNVLLEAAAMGRPVIATNIPGCRETFDEGITGFGCEPRNAQSLAEAMMRFIRLPWEQKKQMGIAGREKMEREFDRNIVIDAYMKEIENII